MQGFYKYLNTNNFANPFKITVQNGGYTKKPPGQINPDGKHPESHYFTYKMGRVLDEYQILYLIEGEGIFETKSSGIINLQEGDIFFLFPGEWHRYKPKKTTGWYEYWIGFTSDFSEFFEDNPLISRKNPVVKIGFNEQILDLYNQILDLLKNYSVGAQYLISGLATHLLSYIIAHQERHLLGYSEHINDLINKAKVMIAKKMDAPISPEGIAENLNISYSWFRRTFKKYTGFTPKEYQLEVQLANAKNLLLTTQKPIKEISYESGFNSQYHFSKMFKLKNKISPTDYRKQMTFFKV